MYLIDEHTRDLFQTSAYQTIRITVGKYIFSPSDILQNSFRFDTYCSKSNHIEIGNVTSAQISFDLKNDNGQWDNVLFDGQEVFVEIGIRDWYAPRWKQTETLYIPVGYFIITNTVKSLTKIKIKALDRMIKLDNETQLTGKHTLFEILKEVCKESGVQLCNELIIKTYPNATYVATVPTKVTNRQLVSYVAQLMGKNAFINRHGQLDLKWFTDTDIAITSRNRYEHTLSEYEIEITGLVYKEKDNDKEKLYVSGDKEYALDLSANKLITSDYQVLLDNVCKQVKGFKYKPYTAVTKPIPYADVMDVITFVDKDKNIYRTPITHIAYGLNTNTSIAGVGKKEKLTYGTVSAVSSNILQEAKLEVIKSSESVVNSFNGLTRSLGLYETTLYDKEKTPIHYWHNQKTLEESTKIYVVVDGVYKWTDSWNKGKPTWHTEQTRESNLIYQSIMRYGLNGNYINSGVIDDKTHKNQWDIEMSEIHLTDDSVSINNEELPKYLSTRYLSKSDLNQELTLLTLDGKALKLTIKNGGINAIAIDSLTDDNKNAIKKALGL